jgi:hypothetical protein
MKKVIALLVGITVACSVSATPIISSTLGIESEAGVSPLVVSPDLGAPLVAQSAYVTASSVTIHPTVVIPEPTAFTLLVVAFGVCGLRKLRRRHDC